MTDRHFYRDLINKIERAYPVTEWIHNGYYIWPVLRIRLYLMMVSIYEETGSSSQYKGKSRQRWFADLYAAARALKQYRSLKKNQINTVYCGAPSHRVNYMAKQYNRYFDYLMDKNEPEESLLIEYKSDNKDGYYKPERVFLFDNLMMLFKIFSSKYRVGDELNPYASKLDQILRERGYEVENLAHDLSQVIGVVDRSYLVFSKILQKIEPKKIIELCYYSPAMFGLNIAAHNMGIPTADLQHGPQGKYHLAYGSWNLVPPGGYEALPDTFYTWDSASAEAISSWADSNKKHKAIVTGNPWVEGWKNRKFATSGSVWPEKLILYTLQPIGNPLDDYILHAVEQTKSKWNWWFRVHPRQLHEVPELEDKLKKRGLIDFVNITEASNLPLPEILVNTSVHITKFSGCAVEAYSFGTPTILLDERGKESFSHYLHDDLMDTCFQRNADVLIQEIGKKMNGDDS